MSALDDDALFSIGRPGGRQRRISPDAKASAKDNAGDGSPGGAAVPLQLQYHEQQQQQQLREQQAAGDDSGDGAGIVLEMSRGADEAEELDDEEDEVDATGHKAHIALADQINADAKQNGPDMDAMHRLWDMMQGGIVNAEAEKWPDDYSQTSSMVAQQLDKVCIVAPGGKPHCFTFNEARGGTMNWDTRALRDTHLCAFKHVPGSVVGDMFSSYAFADPDGGPDQRYHLHHASRVPCEVLDPGAWLRPAEPLLWSDDDALSDLKTPALDTLEDIDPLAQRETVDCPRCHRHHMPHLRSMELLGHSRTPLEEAKKSQTKNGRIADVVAFLASHQV